ncbi:hypothetical protein ACPXB3_22260 [Gordonia sp. DT219]|uniref:hypothetical protein n=1 Tax=Gordonia sp. DT219 TaxID=3416658 RepID=UPI003CEBFF0E
MTAREAIARSLRYEDVRDEVIEYDDGTRLARMALGGLRANGFAVVELPKPDRLGNWVPADPTDEWCVHIDEADSDDDPPVVWIEPDESGSLYGFPSPARARAFAAALLAAANAAEEGQR